MMCVGKNAELWVWNHREKHTTGCVWMAWHDCGTCTIHPEGSSLGGTSLSSETFTFLNKKLLLQPSQCFYLHLPLFLTLLHLCLKSCYIVFLAPHQHLFKDFTTHTIIQLSLCSSLMSATEVRVWVFCPRATQPGFTVTVTPALPATLDPQH